MTQQNRLFWFSVLSIFAVGFGWGYSQQTPRAWAAPAHSISHLPSVSQPSSVSPVMVAPAAVIQGQGSCRPEVVIQKIERIEIGTVTESFEVGWVTAGLCVTEFEVSLLITRADGSQRDEKRKFSKNGRFGVFKLAGKRDNNLTKTAKAVVTAIGILAAKGSKEVSLAIGGGVGSSGGPAPTPVPTFALQGRVINSQTGTGIVGVTLTFEVVGLPRRTSSVETDNQGSWQQGGFPIGRRVRVTAFKRFFVMEPAELLLSEGLLAKFTGRPSEVGASPTPTPALTFTAGGRAVVDSLSQGTQTPLPGATITFKVLNAKPGQANVPGPVTTGKDGRWTQSRFTVGSFTYQATISKPGVTFALPTANFGSTTTAPVGDAGFIGTVK